MKNGFGVCGFTLIELLVVVLIIGILSAVALPQYQKAVEKSRLTEALVQGRALLNAQQIFVLSNGHMSNNLDELSFQPSPTAKWLCSDTICIYRDSLATKNVVFEISAYFGYTRPSLWCIAWNDYGQNLCRSFGGKESHTTVDGPNAGHMYYLIYK